LATSWVTWGREALVHLQKGLEIRLKLLGSEHPSVATSCTNIGNVYMRMGDLENALVQHQKGLEIKLKLLGSEHPHVDTSYHNLTGHPHTQMSSKLSRI
jgi:hypothetical protein